MRNLSLSEKAYNQIKEKLIHAEKGNFLSIRDCAAELEMSYTPVREAFLKLHKEGFLDLIPNVGFFTTQMKTSEILQAYQVRECIEPFVLQKVFNMIAEKDIKNLEEHLEEQKRALVSNNIYQYIVADIKFHKAIIDVYDNNYLSELYKSTREQYLICSNKIAESHAGDAIEEHSELLHYIKAKDQDKAMAILNSHIEKAKQRVKEGYQRIMDF